MERLQIAEWNATWIGLIFPNCFAQQFKISTWFIPLCCGFFAEGEALWFNQSNEGYTPDEPGDDFWQFNLYAGYHFPRRKAEVTLGLLNLAGQDYNLNPLNIYNELPRARTLAVSLQFNF
jgi:hypothetical protein